MSDSNCPHCGSKPTPALRGRGGQDCPTYDCGTMKNGPWMSELCKERQAHNKTKAERDELLKLVDQSGSVENKLICPTEALTIEHMKYRLTENTKVVDGITLYQIEALKDFENIDFYRVKKGELGGWVESDKNLSQDGNCWVRENASVYGNAIVTDNAVVIGNARVLDNARVSDNARVTDSARVYRDAQVSGKARVADNAQVFDNARMSGKTRVFQRARVFGNAQLTENAQVFNNAWVCDDAKISGDAVIYGSARVYDRGQVTDKAHVLGHAHVIGEDKVAGESTRQYGSWC